MRCRLVVKAAIVSGMLFCIPAAALASHGAAVPDSAFKDLIGFYASDSQPPSQAVISSFLPRQLEITIVGEHGFTSTGFWDGEQYVGILAVSDGSVPGGVTGGYAWLRLTRMKDGRLQVERWLPSVDPEVHRDVWTRIDKSQGRGAPLAEPARGDTPGAADGLPKSGEYVYVEELPEALEKVAPAYPEWARQKGIEGTVIVMALIGRDGRVKDTQIKRSIPELDDYAIAAVKQWRFAPARTKGKPLAVWVAIPVKFSLH
jgi:TonB family protein